MHTVQKHNKFETEASSLYHRIDFRKPISQKKMTKNRTYET